jgi:hypothetical protein
MGILAMDALQDLLTSIAIFLEYFIFGYLAVAFVLYAFERQAGETAIQANPHLIRQEDPVAASPKRDLVLVPVG